MKTPNANSILAAEVTRSTKSSLAPLLIISAIDLLICSFTMGVMLFLIFQPSQRSDRGSAIMQSLGSRSESQSVGLGARNSPAVIVVENLSENRFAAVDVPAGYRAIGSSKQSGRTLAFAASIGDQNSSLTLESRRGNGKTEALISVARGGNLFTKAVRCSSDAGASVVLSEKPAVEIDCRSPQTFCSVGSYPLGQSSIDRRSIDRKNAAVIVFGRNSTGTIQFADGKVCLASPIFGDAQREKWAVKISKELAATAKSRCNADASAGLRVVSDDQAECVFDAPEVVADDRWLIDCFDKSVSLNGQAEDTAYILFMGDDGAGVCSQVKIAE